MADASSFDHFSVRCVVLAPNPQVHTTIFVHGEEPPKPGWPHPWQDDQDQAGHALLERRRGNGTIYENGQIACAISTPSTTLRPRRLAACLKCCNLVLVKVLKRIFSPFQMSLGHGIGGTQRRMCMVQSGLVMASYCLCEVVTVPKPCSMVNVGIAV